MKRLVVKWRDGHCNLPITHIRREECVIEAYRDDEFVGMFDLGAVDMLYVTEVKGAEVCNE